MLTLALNPECYVAYDLEHCTLYEAWKGGVRMEGAPYTSKKNIQPTVWGTPYLKGSLRKQKWSVLAQKKELLAQISNRGYSFKNNQIYLNYALLLTTGDSIFVQERPEFVRSDSGKPGLERWYRTSNVPAGMSVFLKNENKTFQLKANSTTVKTDYFDPLPERKPSKLIGEYGHRGLYWMEESDCFTCHEIKEKSVGPSFVEIAEHYPKNEETKQRLMARVVSGGSGVWGENPMNAHNLLSENELSRMLDYIFTLKTTQTESKDEKIKLTTAIEEKPKYKPGFGAPLEAVHPSYSLSTLHSEEFRPKVGGLAFLPDGRLLVTTWDTEGAVYLLDNIETGDAAEITKKRIASGLHEPLGIEVVDEKIYVLQKHELTQLIDLDGDEITDEYRAVCNAWQVTADFHEFAFGLVHHENHFYVSLSMAMRLLSGEKQKPDRGRTLKIAFNGSYETLNYGLRTPNGIGLGVDDELFVTDNQGQWLPGNKLVHVRKGEYHGMAWGLTDSIANPPKMTPPTLWLPQNEIGNSPSEPILIRDGPYNGQMLHGDVSHGGIKRDFLEKVNGRYQGAVFRFTQGLHAGVNRLCYGPDGAIYIGEVGMKGGWGWKDKMYGLERLKYNGKPTFEILAIRARPKGFEIEFTQPLEKIGELKRQDFLMQQWRYLPTADYGGPKLDLENILPNRIEPNEDKTKVYLEVSGLKEKHVVYFHVPYYLKSTDGQSLWSSEAWYTLNAIPEK